MDYGNYYLEKLKILSVLSSKIANLINIFTSQSLTTLAKGPGTMIAIEAHTDAVITYLRISIS